jgi:CheY-like chemotaxis protein
LQEKVLIVEDEVHARTGLTELVSSWGYRARGAADGREGLDQVIAWQPAIIVTDLKMPRMDGMELLRRIGDLPERYCVVMLTAQGSIESAVEAMRAGAWDYLPKPVDPARLRGKRPAPGGGGGGRKGGASGAFVWNRTAGAEARCARTDDRLVAGDEGGVFSGRARSEFKCERAGDGRERDGQGTRRACSA